MIHIEAQGLAAGIPKAEALAWWWDLREGTVDHRFLTVAPSRRVTTLAEGEVLVEDEVRRAGIRLFHERLVARLDGYAIYLEGENTFATFEGAYTFEDAPGGTQVSLEADVHLRSGWILGQPVAKPVVERILRQDLDGHLEEMVADLEGQPREASTHKATPQG